MDVLVMVLGMVLNVLSLIGAATVIVLVRRGYVDRKAARRG